jgi:hypothetical protein
MDINWKAIARTSNSLLSFHALTIYFMHPHACEGRCMEMRFLAYRSSSRSCRSTRDERCQPSPIYRQLPAGSLHRALADERRALMILQRTGNDLCGRGRTAVDEDDDRFALGEVASRYRHPRYARSDQKRARPKDSRRLPTLGNPRPCPTSRTSEHSSAGARGYDVRMFGCLPLDGPRAKAVCLPDCGRTCP